MQDVFQKDLGVSHLPDLDFFKTAHRKPNTYFCLYRLASIFFFSFYLISRKKKDRKLYPCCWSNHDEQRGGHQTSNQLEITNNHRQSSL